MSPAINFDPQSPEITAIDLARALDRLERKILATPPEPRLLYDSFERTKTAANLEYTRTLLLRLEHTSSRLKIQSRRQAAQSTLLSQRALLKRLTDRLHEFDQQDLDWPSDASPSEDLLSDEEPTTTPALDTAIPPSTTTQPDKASSGLRNRFRPPSPASKTDTTPPFPDSKENTTTFRESATSTQADLTTALTSLATQLKTNSLLFSTSLEKDKAAMAQASESLDKNADGMANAGKKMGLLRRMNEGQGWWGRMMLYAWIGGLWVAAVGLVFVGPKFRF